MRNALLRMCNQRIRPCQSRSLEFAMGSGVFAARLDVARSSPSPQLCNTSARENGLLFKTAHCCPSIASARQSTVALSSTHRRPLAGSPRGRAGDVEHPGTRRTSRAPQTRTRASQSPDGRRNVSPRRHRRCAPDRDSIHVSRVSGEGFSRWSPVHSTKRRKT